TQVQITAVRHYDDEARVHNLTIADIHTYYVLADQVPVLVHNCGIALGMRTPPRDGRPLEEFADDTGADAYWDWPSGGEDFVEELKEYVKDGKTTIHFNLDGIDHPREFAAMGAGINPKAGEHVTAWELHLVSSNPNALARTKFYRNNEEVDNPFD
ncbi:hypothetical protein, partial [Actinoplanes xinjiangensis]